MFYTIYKITNKSNGMIYIGCHKTSNLDDDYMGSGTYLLNAQKKYGIENFEKEILEVFDNPEAMFEMESILVTPEFVDRKDTYNLRKGGYGGWSHLTKKQRSDVGSSVIKDNYENMRRCLEIKRMNDPEFDKLYRQIRSDLFRGKKHSDETKQKIGKASSDHQRGEGNSQYGMMWIYSLEEKQSKRISPEDFPQWESEGWLKGRKMKFL